MYTDIHSHVIWGTDDGAKTKEETLRMLREAAADKIERIICTPHVIPGVYEFPEAVFQAHFREAEEWIRENGLPLQLYGGAEVLYTEALPRMLRENRIPTMAGSRYVLVEFNPDAPRAAILDGLQRIVGSGYLPIVAHLERYVHLHSADQVWELKERCLARIQINARSLIRRQPILRRKFFSDLFREGLVDFIATDTHAAPGRESCMVKGMEALRERYGASCANAILGKQDLIFAAGNAARFDEEEADPSFDG